MTKSSNPFDQDAFIDRFLSRRAEQDSVNATIDEPAILSLVVCLRPDRVLELGCAAGGLTRGLVEVSSYVMAVDGSKALIEKAAAAVPSPKVNFACARFEQLSVDGVFDCVVSGLAFHLVEDLDGLLRNVFSWLKPGGHLIFSVRHPIRTALPTGEYSVGERRGWTVSDYYKTGPRTYTWLGENVTYFHRSVGTLFRSLTESGFAVCELSEPLPVASGRSERVMENESVPAILLFCCVRLK